MTDWTPGWSPHPPAPDDLVLALNDGLIVRPAKGWLHPWRDLEPMAGNIGPIYVGEFANQPVYVTDLDPEQMAGTPHMVDLRDALILTDDSPAELLSTAVQVFQWWRDHQFCGRCGQQTGVHPRERAKWCRTCEIPWYPRLAPCVIVVIRRDDRFLLAKNARVKRHFFSLIAGFVEAGESSEQAVAREVKEETGLDVTNIRYQTSQPWPFPHQLMLGYFADYAGGDLVLQEDEIAEADWFLPDDLPPVPPMTTIAGRLIHAMEAEIRNARSGG